MDLAIQTPQQTADLGRLGELWEAADELGYRAAFTFDHLVPLYPGERPGSEHEGPRTGAQLDGWLTAAALAGRTRRLHVGTLVSGVTYRHPFVLAKQAVTLDRITSGRAVLGVGAGWHRAEHDMVGLPFPPPGVRVRLLAETLEVFRRLCGPEPVTFHGEHVRLTDALFEPKPVRPSGIPVLVGGSGLAVMRVAARYGQYYNGFWTPEEWPSVHERLDAELASEGRDGTALSRTGYTFGELSGSRIAADELVARTVRTRGGTPEAVCSRLLVGDEEHLTGVLRRYRDAGLRMLVVSLDPGTAPDDLARLARAAEPLAQEAPT
jgi:alkanesulfonate monooxygenase SsuD/methylene tetrahydromethanopterin reductase-like flavin-dependent oxidoreductase (luciferase family)